MFLFHEFTGDDKLLNYVQREIEKRGVYPETQVPHCTQPFCCITFALFNRIGRKAFIKPFINETNLYRYRVKRDYDGAIIHSSCNPRGILIDYLQDYASRMAKAGYLSGDATFFDECVQQYKIYRKILRDPKTGLWSQGRGWLEDPKALSPGAWSRGHGWLVRGMVDSLLYLPQDSQWQKEMVGMLKELAADLLKYQDENGMWHQLLNYPFSESYPESSGTALISYNISRSLYEGYLEGEDYKRSVRKAVSALMKCVTPRGIVLHTCHGPGPLQRVDPWLNKPAEPDDPHGAPTLIFGAIGGILQEKQYNNNRK